MEDLTLKLQGKYLSIDIALREACRAESEKVVAEREAIETERRKLENEHVQLTIWINKVRNASMQYNTAAENEFLLKKQDIETRQAELTLRRFKLGKEYDNKIHDLMLQRTKDRYEARILIAKQQESQKEEKRKVAQELQEALEKGNNPIMDVEFED